MSGNQTTDVNPHFDLDTWPLWSPDQASHEPLGETIRVMKSTGFRKLGFAIVRGTSDGQDAWDRLVARIRQNAFDYLDIRQELLGRFLDFPVLEGSNSEEGQGVAENLDDACAAFEQWSRNAASNYHNMPRFNYFVHVDKKCLDSFVERDNWEKDNPEIADLWTRGPPCFVKLVRAEQERPEQGGSVATEELASIRRRAEEIAAANPQMAEAVFAELASAEAAAGVTTSSSAGNTTANPGYATGEASNNGDDESEDESEDESVASSFFEQHSRWFYIHVNPLLGMYNKLHDRSNWELWYVQPPEVSRG